ncbi:Lge1p KNAG_0A02120 [Huiozyma naganishii CBS 8797]|uniref:Transcription regulator LGE1 helical region domain-containing protein n=1 Tax=Huiozyma naganishii (strain ATCC MYA-139 / BCRC 22969 / CBS 8797 / KCTC 17520 / NBRC 10181 / NCYC 3082 / Yp74L-3) TaxID=1071383 RepID=J7S3B2_HUIN7|nr:hypothetical protein KNAG_0A02120 [Kazachstania naganishii CBS 8797]CCK67901.1 hypothetical protein KNAG_0A02120 [Kazachstania naganishii CBS 8797]
MSEEHNRPYNTRPQQHPDRSRYQNTRDTTHGYQGRRGGYHHHHNNNNGAGYYHDQRYPPPSYHYRNDYYYDSQRPAYRGGGYHQQHYSNRYQYRNNDTYYSEPQQPQENYTERVDRAAVNSPPEVNPTQYTLQPVFELTRLSELDGTSDIPPLNDEIDTQLQQLKLRITTTEHELLQLTAQCARDALNVSQTQEKLNALLLS